MRERKKNLKNKEQITKVRDESRDRVMSKKAKEKGGKWRRVGRVKS